MSPLGARVSDRLGAPQGSDRPDFVRLGALVQRARERAPAGPSADVISIAQWTAPVAAASDARIAAPAASRPALPPAAKSSPRRLAGVLACSAALHLAVFGGFAVFVNEPLETASIGEDAITVEIVVGATEAAGNSDQASAVETENRSAADAQPRETEEATRQEGKPAEPETKTAREEAKEPPRAESVPQEFATLVPPDEALARETPRAEPEREPEQKPPERPRSTPAPSVAASAANSIGRGRMSGDANYQGRVAAHLARYKRFPADARRRREQGSALVAFNIDGAGKVTAVKLVRGSGHAPLDREAEAMVHRASPFPPPPGGSARSFTAPVSFSLN